MVMVDLSDSEIVDGLVEIEKLYDGILSSLNRLDDDMYVRGLKRLSIDRYDLHDICQELFVINYLLYSKYEESNLTKPSRRSFLRCFNRCSFLLDEGLLEDCDVVGDIEKISEVVKYMSNHLSDIEWYDNL